MTTNTSIVLPVRNRTSGAARTIASIFDTCPLGSCEIILVVQQSYDTFVTLSGYVDRSVFYHPKAGQLSVHAWNLGTHLVSEETSVVVGAASDMTFLPGWYQRMWSAIEDPTKPLFLNLIDEDVGERACTHQALTKEALNRYFDGYLYPPCYHGRYCDNEMYIRAHAYLIYKVVPGVSVKHHHFSRGEAEYDTEYKLLDEYVAKDEATFNERGWK